MRVLYDIDSTLADIITPWLAIYNDRFDDCLTPEDITDWDIKKFVKLEAKSKMFPIINEPYFYDYVRPIKNVLNFLHQDLVKGDEVGIITSCNNNTNMIEGKLKWLKKWVPQIDPSDVMFVNNKGWGSANFLVDDRPKNIMDFLDHNPKSRGYLIKQPHNRITRDELRDEKYIDRIRMTINEMV